MSSVTSGAIQSTSSTYNGDQVNLSVNINGNPINGYDLTNVSVFNPAGFFSKPMPGRLGLIHLSPYGTTGYVMGFGNEAPTPVTGQVINNIADLVDGEAAICETSNFNFNIKGKLDKLLSTFVNNNNVKIDSTIAISENVVTILTDIIAEIVALEAAYNQLVATFNAFNATFQAHVHSGVMPGTPTQFSGGTTTPFPTNSTYTVTPNFNRDKTCINNAPSKMYINLNGELIS